MRIIRFTSYLIFINLSMIYAQVGIGVSGGAQFPGFSKSENFDSRFSTGPGYGFLFRHDLYRPVSNYSIHARYMVKFFFNNIDLPNSGATNFEFTNFSAGLIISYLGLNRFPLYAGLSVDLMTATAVTRYVDYNDEALLPIVFFGMEYQVMQSYNLFAECFFQYGEIDTGRDILKIHGAGLFIGATMFLSD